MSERHTHMSRGSQPSIAVLTPHFAPESNAASNRLTALVDMLVADDWTVTVVTLAPNHPEYRIYTGYGTEPRVVTAERGATIVRYRPWLPTRRGLVTRLLAETLFASRALIEMLRRRPDMVLATSPFMFLGPVAWVAARLTRARFTWDVRDLTWQYLAATGRRTYGLDALLDQLMRSTAARADVLTTATHGQLAHFARRPSRSETIVNGLARERFDALAMRAPPSPTSARRPTVTYAGLIGYPQGLGVALDAAERLPEVDFVLAGDGPERARLEAETERRALSNVRFVGHLALPELAALYGSSDVLFAHLRDHAAFRLAQPSKLWEYMAAGRPVVYAGADEASRIIQDHELGIVCAPDDASALADAIGALLANPDHHVEVTNRALDYVRENRDRDALTRRWVALLRSARKS